jgi:hypothetical protein
MPEVFINYRTGDGDEAAALVEAYLSNRFGKERIFRATRTIEPGERYPQALLTEARRCAVMLSIMGPQWSRDPRLADENDWVRREILTAHDCAAVVIPVIKGRATPRLNGADLPTELAWLADVHSLRLDVKDNERDLARMGDKLADRIPSLREADKKAVGAAEPTDPGNSATHVSGPVLQARDFGAAGPVHLGTGDINTNSPRISLSGEGATYIGGDNHGGVNPAADNPDTSESAG